MAKSEYNINNSEEQRRKGLKELLKVMNANDLYIKLMKKFEETRMEYLTYGHNMAKLKILMNKYHDDAIWVKKFIKPNKQVPIWNDWQ